MRLRILLCFLCWSAASVAQEYNLPLSSNDSTLIIVDSVESAHGMAGLTPDQIALINVVKSSRLEERYGPRAANGVIYVETKAFARRRYNQLFSQLSPAYAQALRQYGSDSAFQYILDGDVLTQNVEPMLAALEKDSIAGIEMVSPAQLGARFRIKGKQAGVLIKTGKARGELKQ